MGALANMLSELVKQGKAPVIRRARTPKTQDTGIIELGVGEWFGE